MNSLLLPFGLLIFSFGQTNGGERIYHELQPLDLSPEVQALCYAYWEWRLNDMPEFATLVGVHDYDDRLDDMSETAYLGRYRKCQEFLIEVNTLEPTLTSEVDLINIGVLKYELLTYTESYYLQGYFLPMNYMEGVHVNLESLFEKMLRDSYEDYNIMLKRMQGIPTQIDQLITLMIRGVDNNITYNAISMKNMNKALSRFVVDDPTESPFYVFFKDGFPDTFTPDEISTLQTTADIIISDEVTPAYEALRFYILNKYVTREEIGITTINRGDEFYNQLIWFHTSTNLTAQEIQDIGFAEVDRIEKEMYDVMFEMGYGDMNTQEFSDMIRNDPNNFYHTADDLMGAFEDIVYDLVPPLLPEIFKNIPTAELVVVASPSAVGPVAYYEVGSLDGSRPGLFHVNTYNPEAQPKYSMLTLSLHEGNPGHHLQISHSIESPNFPYFRRVSDLRNYGMAPSKFPFYSYYVEGWALYAESLGFDMKLYGDPLEKYGHYSEEIYRACRLVVDTGMHALGWTRNQSVEYMYNHTALTVADIQNEVDRYITWPGQALAYKMGQLKIQDLRNQSQTDLEDYFHIKDFHDVVLNAKGPMTLVESEVNKWIDEVLAGITTLSPAF